MPERLIEIYLPENQAKHLRDLMQKEGIESYWSEDLNKKMIRVKVLSQSGEIEGLLDRLESEFGQLEEYRVIVVPVEASLPRPQKEEDKETEGDDGDAAKKKKKKKKKKAHRLNREELYNDVISQVKLDRVFLAMVMLSAIVAAIGLMRNNVAVVIGAMVLAPLLGPNVALALATTLGDLGLAIRALKVNVAGVTTALIFAFLFGLLFDFDPETREIATRTDVGLSDVLLALAAGAAGVLSFTAGVSSTLIGVMVAVALLPPLVALGMLMGGGYWDRAMGALLLLATNIVCINLAGVVTFLIEGIAPRTWWESEKARKATRIAISLWIFTLLILVLLIYLWPRFNA